MPISVRSWWCILCVVSALNVIAWTIAATALLARRTSMSRDTYLLCRQQLLLCAVYVFGCAYRAAVPVFDIPRICMFDSWLSSVFIGRSIATIAELCFVAQWALILHKLALEAGSRFAVVASRVVLPMIALAEICSWYSVLTTSNLGHVAEESIWGLSAALMVVSMVVISSRCSQPLRRALSVICVIGVAYVTYMFLVDVPLYWARWIADELLGRHYLGLAQGFKDVSSRWVVSHNWADWRHEVIWKSLYFSVAVWLSIFLIHAPIPAVNPLATVRRRIASVPA